MQVKAGTYTMEEARRLGLIDSELADLQEPRVATEAKGDTAPRVRVKRQYVSTWGNLPLLRMTVEGLRDATTARISAVHRAERGGVADKHQQEAIKAPALALENEYRRLLIDTYQKNVPTVIQDWAAEIPGLASGALFPSIIALIGNPRAAHPYKWVPGREVGSKDDRVLVEDGEPYARSLRQLWQWCGCGDPMLAPKFVSTKDDQFLKLRMGKRTTLRPRLYTFTSYLQRQSGNSNVAGSKYGKLLAEAKADGLTKVHTVQCQNKKRPPMSSNGCGTVANPEQGAPGTPWRPGHAQAHSHRIVQKEFLRDLWEVAGTI